ncbi:MAG: hypothetical protein U0K68_00085 [Agathobacter sp.]|nr:hypothetical protein [Agathobacter sp.]
MKKTTIRALVLGTVFLVSCIIFSITTNKVNEDMTVAMSEASIPIISFYNGDTEVNALHGYLQEMDALEMRDSIIPIDSKRKLNCSIKTYGEGIDGISYEIRSLDNERLVAEGQLNDYKVKQNKISIALDIPNALELEQEYLMIFRIVSGDRNIYYYSRIIQTNDCNVEQCLAFAREFHEKTFEEKSSKYFPTYMDATNGQTDRLDYVDLSCTLSQIRWGDYKGKPVNKPIIEFKEINDSYNVITIKSVVSNVTDKGETEFVNVEEYFRLRYSEERMYVLNYERRANQIFSGSNTFVTENNKLTLGMRDEDVEYMSSESGSIVCFVQEGELWSYNKDTSEIAKVFSFRGPEGIDDRENWDQHDIKIVRIDEAGSIDFIVYGYMNRGEHEGQVGASVFHYDGLAYTIEEEAFIPSNTSYEVLKAEMGRLMYENDKGTLFFMLEGNVYTIDMNTLKVDKMITGLGSGCYAVSENNKYFAWVETEKQYSSNTLHIMNLQTEEVKDISEDSGRYVKPMGFIDQDFIYGVAETSKVKTDAAGYTTFAMSSLKILNTSEDRYEMLKEYKPAKGYVESIDIDDYTVTVNLIKASGQQYLPAGTDAIMNHEADAETSIVVDRVSSPDKMSEIVLTISVPEKATKCKLISSQGILVENDRTVNIKESEKDERFYVYVKGDVILATDSISEAISNANEKMGVVVDSKQQYVWQRARKTYAQSFTGMKPSDADKNASNVAKGISAMLMRKEISISVSEMLNSGMTAKEVLEQALTDSVVLDVSGCKSEDILFYVSEGSPVFGMTGNKSAVLVIGYSTTHVHYYNPASGKTESKTFEEANKMFLRGGYRFFTYIDR